MVGRGAASHRRLFDICDVFARYSVVFSWPSSSLEKFSLARSAGAQDGRLYQVLGAQNPQHPQGRNHKTWLGNEKGT